MKRFMEDKNSEEFGLDMVRCLAKKAKIDKYYWMRKAELISALKTVWKEVFHKNRKSSPLQRV